MTSVSQLPTPGPPLRARDGKTRFGGSGVDFFGEPLVAVCGCDACWAALDGSRVGCGVVVIRTMWLSSIGKLCSQTN